MSHYTYTVQFTHTARESIESHLYAHRILTHLTCLLLSRNPGCQCINANPKSILGRWMYENHGSGIEILITYKSLLDAEHAEASPNKPNSSSKSLNIGNRFCGISIHFPLYNPSLRTFFPPKARPSIATVRGQNLGTQYTIHTRWWVSNTFFDFHADLRKIQTFTNSFQIGLNPPPSYSILMGIYGMERMESFINSLWPFWDDWVTSWEGSVIKWQVFLGHV